MAGVVEAPGYAPIACVSPYFQDGVGLDEFNLALLGKARAVAASAGCNWQIAGDFNIPALTLEQADI